MRKYQGEDIAFSIKFDNQSNPTLKDFTDIANVIVHAYTGDDSVQMFSREDKDKYSKLNIVSDTELQGIITSEYTSLMSGQIYLEIMFEISSEVGDLKENVITKTPTGVIIVGSRIKDSI